MPVDPQLLAVVRDLHIERDHLRHVVEGLTAIGSTPLGSRTAGTPEDAAVAEFVRAELAAAGLVDVSVEPVEVDAWRFLGASVTVGEFSCEASSFGGVPGTFAAGVTGPLVDAGTGLRTRLDACDIRDAVVLVDWRGDGEPAAVALELARRGAVGMVLWCSQGGQWFQTPGALGAFDGNWPSDGPPMVFVSAADAVVLQAMCAGARPDATVVLAVESAVRATGGNVVGHLPGREPGLVVVGAHSDAWFRGAFDNTSGVAALIALARALVCSGHRPRHTVCFTTRTAEEYGVAGTVYDWCTGAWEQVQTTHSQWADDAVFHLCLEATGHPALRTVLEAPLELETWAAEVGRAAAAEGWTPTGWRVAPPVAGTEQWPFLVSGVPGVAAYCWEADFGRTDYHTQYDTLGMLDLAHLEAQTRLYGLLLLEADRDPDGILEHSRRARRLAAVAAVTGSRELAAAALAHSDVRGRGAFTAVGRAMFALVATGSSGLPHQQALCDVRALDAALAALDAGDRAGAATALRKVGMLVLFPYLSEEVFAEHAARYLPERLSRSFARASHLTASPHLWAELAALLDEPGTGAYGPWVRHNLVEARVRSHDELRRRLMAMVAALNGTSR